MDGRQAKSNINNAEKRPADFLETFSKTLNAVWLCIGPAQPSVWLRVPFTAMGYSAHHAAARTAAACQH